MKFKLLFGLLMFFIMINSAYATAEIVINIAGNADVSDGVGWNVGTLKRQEAMTINYTNVSNKVFTQASFWANNCGAGGCPSSCEILIVPLNASNSMPLENSTPLSNATYDCSTTGTKTVTLENQSSPITNTKYAFVWRPLGASGANKYVQMKTSSATNPYAFGSWHLQLGGTNWLNIGDNYDFNLTLWIDDAPAGTPTYQSNLTFASQMPTNNTQWGIGADNIWYNVTFRNQPINASGMFVQCDLMVDGTVLDSPYGNFNSTLDGNGTLSYNGTPFTNGTHSYNWTCDNGGASANTFTSPTYVFYTDVAAPTLITNLTNGTYHLNDYLLARFNASDDQSLYLLNITISPTFNYQNNTLGGATNFIYDANWQMSSYPVGRNNVSVKVCDGHTDGVIDNMDVSSTKSALTFNDITISSKTTSTKTSYQKLMDRYTFAYEYASPLNQIQIQMPNECKYQPNSKYKGHFVCKDKYWVDFEGAYSVSVIGQVVTITSAKPLTKWSFNSIGELNCITETFYFYNLGASTTYTTPVIEAQPNRYNLTVTGNVNASLMYAEFWYDNVAIANGTESDLGSSLLYSYLLTTPTITSLNKTVSQYWKFYYPDGWANISNSTDVYSVRVDNCSLYSTRSINFTTKLFPAGTIVNSEGATISVNYRNAYGVERNTSSVVGAFNLTGYCIYPNWAEAFADFWIEYTDSDYGTFSFYTDNTTMDNVTNVVTLYYTNDTVDITYEVVDSDDDPVEDAFITVLQFNPNTNDYEQIQVLKTDYLGVAVGQGTLNTIWYKFIITVDGVVRLTTIGTKLTSTSRTFRLEPLSDFMDRYTDVLGIQSSLTWSNATNLFTFTWVDPSATISAGCLRVVKRTASADTTLSDECTSSASGSMTYNLTNVGQNTYIATGYVHFDEEFTLQTLTIALGRIFEAFRTDGVLMSFLLILTITFVGIASPVIAIILAVIGFIITNILGLFYMDWQYLMLLVILGGLVIYRITRTNY